MASAPYDDQTDARADEQAARAPRLGEQIFIWVAWALAAAFWGAYLTSQVEVLRAVARPAPRILSGFDVSTPGQMAYLILVAAAFVSMALALAYGLVRTSRGASRPSEARHEPDPGHAAPRRG